MSTSITAHTQKRVLLVEDDALVAMVTQEELEHRGFVVELAETADEAWAILKAGELFDLVMSDIRMPGSMDGIDLKLRIRVTYPDLPVLLVTGFEDMARLALVMGKPLLRKPYRGAELDEWLVKLLKLPSGPVSGLY